MEHAPPIQPEFSWRETAPKLALLITIALIGLGGWILVRPDGTRAAAPQIKQAPLRPRAATSVLVLNGNGTAGAAGGVATKLLADGYRRDRKSVV